MKHPPRDGIWLNNGLSAEFRFVQAHPCGNSETLVETAAGEHWAFDEELVYDPVRELSPEAAAVIAKETL